MSEWPASDELILLAKAATVGIGDPPGAPEPRLWGSGVLVAPGWVLTCAHLFVSANGDRRGTAEGDSVGVHLGGRLLRSRLAYLVEEFRDGRGPDLALVALAERPAVQSVAWLGEREPLLCENAHLYGYQPSESDEGFKAVDSSCRITGQDGRYLQVAAVSRLRKGYSGGPLVDEDRGEVVGLVRARDGEDLGLVVPVGAIHELAARHHRPGAPDLGAQPGRELLRLHDVWHVRHQDRPGRTSASWTDVRRELPRQRGSWTPLDRLAELDWLSRLPAPARPGVVGQLMPNVSARPVGDWPVPLLTWRDGYVRLGDSEAHHLQFLLAVAAELSRGPDPAVRETVTGLAGWISARRREVALADRQGLEHAHRRPESVLLEFAPLVGYGQQRRGYRWSISHGFGEGEWRPTLQGGDDTGTGHGDRLSLLEAVGEVRDQLRDVLLDADGSQLDGREYRARVEIAAPMEELLAPAHTWRAGQGRLGAEREVVLRNRPHAGVPPGERVRQWQRLATARRLTPRTVDTAADLERLGEGEVPLICRHDSSDEPEVTRRLTRSLLEAGHVVALWREPDREPEPEPEPERAHGATASGAENAAQSAGHAGCHRGDSRVETWMADLKASELPKGLRELRRAAYGGDVIRGGDLILLFDDPANPLPEP
ncbi:trypsin-like peptidase domain-containing protein [Streptacidiphilus sp. P02-A3a]|uniref:trypsin-like peptidase domain-containing protein n=1 Tax=Streptacidiphilus sp. P02-A3a TaxID=2704468 RepID=UPI0015FCEE76|nr:trypsin-like peptidase domain-containing protein [Streptacidiphilus sp. P02-A3a]QMU71785.1 trypsin-like peptidase domain-containing protein [Streptacidiphilus sp. P02-A3a]